jgi:hypothetical protein
MYEMEIHRVAVMRRSSDSWLNSTQVLRLAGIDKAQGDKIIEREILIGEHETIQSGYGRSQGVWISYERGVELCRQYGVEEQLRPLLDCDIGQDEVSKAERGLGTPTKEEVMATKRRRLYAESWPEPQDYIADLLLAHRITVGQRSASLLGRISVAPFSSC